MESIVGPTTRATIIDKLYTKIGNGFRLHLRIEPFAVLFWALGIVLCAYTETVDPTCRPGIPQQLYWHGTLWQGSVRFNLSEDESATCLFRSCCIIYLCRTYKKQSSLGKNSVRILNQRKITQGRHTVIVGHS